MDLYEIEKCETAKSVFRGKWRWGLSCYVFHKVSSDNNILASRHELVASLYYTFSRVKYEMGSPEFKMVLCTINSKGSVNLNPSCTVFSAHCSQLETFTSFVKRVYPSKRPAFCSMSITYSMDYRGKEEYPYFPTNFIGNRLPMINNIDTFKTKECVICSEKPPNMLFCSCGHIAIC